MFVLLCMAELLVQSMLRYNISNMLNCTNGCNHSIAQHCVQGMMANSTSCLCKIFHTVFSHWVLVQDMSHLLAWLLCTSSSVWATGELMFDAAASTPVAQYDTKCQRLHLDAWAASQFLSTMSVAINNSASSDWCSSVCVCVCRGKAFSPPFLVWRVSL